jgi:hypothetical protein
MQLDTGSSEVRQLMSLHEKCGFIEMRLQNLVGDVGDTQRWLSQNLCENDGAESKIKGCKHMCKLWVSSKLRFKDVPQEEFEPKFMKMWGIASSHTLKEAEEHFDNICTKFELPLAKIQRCQALNNKHNTSSYVYFQAYLFNPTQQSFSSAPSSQFSFLCFSSWSSKLDV